MKTGETPSLDPSCCFACLFPSFALCLVNLYDMPLAKCEGDGKAGYKPCLSFFISFSLSYLSRSLHRLSLSSLALSTPLHAHSVHAMYETFTKLEQLVNRILSFSQSIHTTYQTMTDLNGFLIVLFLLFSHSVHVTYETMIDYHQYGARSHLPQLYQDKWQ